MSVGGARPPSAARVAHPSTRPAMWWRRLDVRLFVSYAAVAAAVAIALLVTTRLLVPRLFDRHVGGGAAHGHTVAGPTMRDAVVTSLDRALVVALLIGGLAAGGMAAFVARRVLRPIDRVRVATRTLATGRYDQLVDPPAEEELAGLAQDVNALARALDGSERQRSRLVSDVAHELRTPLTTIRGYTEGMLDGVIPPDGEVLTSILDHVDRLERIAADLGTLSRADEGRLDLRLGRVDLATVAASVVDGLRPRAEAAGVRMEAVGAGPGEVVATADRDRIAQVLTNLVGNAVSYTPAGGRVVVDVAGNLEACTVAVADTGIGLAPPDLERVFVRFYRVEGVGRPPGGSGIGLGIARAIARAHGGDVTATSDGPGRGATFTLHLPRRTVPAGTEPATRRPGAAFTEA